LILLLRDLSRISIIGFGRPLFGSLSQRLRGFTLLLDCASLSDGFLVFWDCISEESSHSFVSYQCIEVDLLELFRFYPFLGPIAHPFDIFLVSYVDGWRFVSIRSQQSPSPRHPTVLGQNSALRTFPLPGHSEELLFPEFVICQLALKFDEDSGVSDSQLDHPLNSLPRPIDIEKLKDLHLLLQNQPPQYVGGKQIPPSVQKDLAWCDH